MEPGRRSVGNSPHGSGGTLVGPQEPLNGSLAACAICGAPCPPSKKGGRPRVTCSEPCAERRQRSQIAQWHRLNDRRRKGIPDRRDFRCVTCGKTWTREPTRGQFPGYCSDVCRRRAREGRHGIDRLAIYDRDGWICQLCDRPVSPKYAHPHRLSATLDHIVPVSLGGSNDPSNLQLAHLKCNTAKGNRASGEQLRIVG